MAATRGLRTDGDAPRSVLIVDGSAGALARLGRPIASEGWQVRTARARDAVLAALETTPPDVVILDLSGWDGDAAGEIAQVIDAVRAQRPEPPLIALTDARSATTDATWAFEVVPKAYDQWSVVRPALARAGQMMAVRRENCALAAIFEHRMAVLQREVRMPLTTVIGYAEMLREDALEDDPARIDLDNVLTAAQHLLGVVEDVSDLTAIEAGRLSIQPGVVSVRGVVSDVIATVRPLAQRRSNDLHVRVDCDAVLFTDGPKLRQCLLNLLGNACKYTEGGQIALEVFEDVGPKGACVRFVVRDTGLGMTPEQSGRLFQAFQAIDARGGAGLGLTITRHFVAALGGDLGMQSIVGRGTAFCLTLPAPELAADIPVEVAS